MGGGGFPGEGFPGEGFPGEGFPGEGFPGEGFKRSNVQLPISALLRIMRKFSRNFLTKFNFGNMNLFS